jgi:hypothetical protein
LRESPALISPMLIHLIINHIHIQNIYIIWIFSYNNIWKRKRHFQQWVERVFLVYDLCRFKTVTFFTSAHVPVVHGRLMFFSAGLKQWKDVSVLNYQYVYNYFHIYIYVSNCIHHITMAKYINICINISNSMLIYIYIILYYYYDYYDYDYDYYYYYIYCIIIIIYIYIYYINILLYRLLYMLLHIIMYIYML